MDNFDNATQVNNETVFVTYCQDNKDHVLNVEGFVAKLRVDGYHATLDQLLMQDHTSIDFRDMMHGQLQQAHKVIIVLSPEYKQKTINEKGGVWIEYQLIRKLIDEEPTKYILASFDGFGDELIPLAFKDRFIVNLRDEAKWKELYARLNDQPLISLPPVGTRRPQIVAREIEPYAIKQAEAKIKEHPVNSELNAVDVQHAEMAISAKDFGYNGNLIKPMFLTSAAEILAATNSKLSWSKSVRRFLDKAMEYDVDIPHTNVAFDSASMGNKRTGFLENLAAFSPEQQFEIINELCDEYYQEEKVPELQEKLIKGYGKALN